MLVMSVLPHHHHAKAICFIITECCNACESEHEDQTAKHSHSESDTSCDLKQLFVMSGRDDSIELQHLHPGADLPVTDLYIALFALINHTMPIPDHRELLITHPPFVETVTALHISRISALRAPPSVIV